MANRDDLTLESELLRLLDAEPFAPFAISLTSGERFEIPAPDLIVGKNVATFVGPGGRSVVIRKNQIVAIDSTIGRRR